MKRQRATVPIYGLVCSVGDALTVERALLETPGVLRAYVNPAIEMAYLEYDEERCGRAQIVHAVERSGFRAGEPAVR